MQFYTYVFIKISLKFVLIDNKSALVIVLTWCGTDDTLLPETLMNQFADAQIYATSINVNSIYFHREGMLNLQWSFYHLRDLLIQKEIRISNDYFLSLVKCYAYYLKLL